MEQELIKSHMEFLKEESILLKEESKLLNKLQNIGENDIDGYVNEIEMKVNKKLGMYVKLKNMIEEFKKHLNEEEEMHTKINFNPSSL